MEVSGSSAPAGAPRGIVARQALFARLAQAGRVTQISAPAGSGKTQLVRSWLEAEGLTDRAAWFTVARDEHDLLRFCVGIIDALRATAAAAEVIRGVTAAPDLNCEALAERLLEDLEQSGRRVWLVIDDVHELPAELVRHLELFILRAPPNLRLILLTRHDMPLGLHRLRLQGELTEIRAPDLAFTLDEARALFEAAGIQLSEAAVRSLHERTEGWAAGLRLAALCLIDHPDPERFAAQFSGSERTVAEFLMAEVLERQPEETRRMLLATSVLERVNGSLADVLTGNSGSEAILHRLEDANAFVVSVDVTRTWFRYHRLFADLLALELRRTAPEQIPVLHAKAARWFADNGFPVEAIRHFQAAREWHEAARLLFDHWVDLRLQGGGQAGHELLEAFPPEIVARDAELNGLKGDAELDSGSLEEGERYLDAAAQLTPLVPESRREQFAVRLTFRRLRLARRRGDVTAVLEEAAVLLAEHGSALTPDLRAILANELGIAELWSLRAEDAEQHLQESLEMSRRIGRPYIETSARSHVAMLAVFESVRGGTHHAERAIAIAERNGWTEAPVIAVAYLSCAAKLLWCGQVTDAEPWLDRARRCINVGPEPVSGLMLQYVDGLLELARERFGAALAAFRANAALSRRVVPDHMLVVKTQAFTLHTLLRMGQLERVARALEEMRERSPDRAEFRLVAAALDLLRRDPRAASEKLAPVLDGSLPMMLPRAWDIQPHLIGAMVSDALGDPGGSERELDRALTLAEPDGALLPFLLHPVAPLLEQYARHRGDHGSLVAEILDLYAGRGLSAAGPDSLREPLSESELRVLRYLPTHLSLKEIGDELYVSVNTVKVHVRHLYAKLGVHGRSQAIERARALGLLAPSLRGR